MDVFLSTFKEKVMSQEERAEYKELSNFYNREHDKVERYLELKKKFGGDNGE